MQMNFCSSPTKYKGSGSTTTTVINTTFHEIREYWWTNLQYLYALLQLISVQFE